MRSEQFPASGRSITLECNVCGSAEMGALEAGSSCTVCGEGKLRWRLQAANRQSRSVKPSEFVVLRAREERIERIASAAPRETRNLPMDPTDDLLDTLEGSSRIQQWNDQAQEVLPEVPINFVERRSSRGEKEALPEAPIIFVERRSSRGETGRHGVKSSDVKPRVEKHAVEPQAATGSPHPVAAALASYFLPGLGQMMSGQIVKGLVFLGLAIALVVLFLIESPALIFVANLFATIDAYVIAKKRRRGLAVQPWEMF